MWLCYCLLAEGENQASDVPKLEKGRPCSNTEMDNSQALKQFFTSNYFQFLKGSDPEAPVHNNRVPHTFPFSILGHHF